jgi:hypothetical protein
VILYCFISRLIIGLPSETVKRDPIEMAQSFFRKTVICYSLNDVTDFLTDMDSEDGPEAVKRRDPADLHDYVLVQLLDKW